MRSNLVEMCREGVPRGRARPWSPGGERGCACGGRGTHGSQSAQWGSLTGSGRPPVWAGGPERARKPPGPETSRTDLRAAEGQSREHSWSVSSLTSHYQNHRRNKHPFKRAHHVSAEVHQIQTKQKKKHQNHSYAVLSWAVLQTDRLVIGKSTIHLLPIFITSHPI